ncbi:MAG: hypothetical protein NTNFB02_01560 [Nitrospira sp.]
MGHVSSDTTKYLARKIQQTTATIEELKRAQERFQDAQAVEQLRSELLRLWTLKRYQLIKRGDVPHSVTVRLGELIKMLNRATSFRDHQTIIEGLTRLVAPYTKTA